jgi:hypothetical protein
MLNPGLPLCQQVALRFQDVPLRPVMVNAFAEM